MPHQTLYGINTWDLFCTLYIIGIHRVNPQNAPGLRPWENSLHASLGLRGPLLGPFWFLLLGQVHPLGSLLWLCLSHGDRSNNIPTINHSKFTEICHWRDIILKGRMYSIQCSSVMAILWPILWPILWSWKQWPFPTTATAATIEACSSYWNPFGIPYTFPFRCLLEIVPQNIHATTIGSLSTGRVEKKCQPPALRIILSITRKD